MDGGKIDKNKQILTEFRRLKRKFKGFADNRQMLANKLMQEVAFMTVTLEDLQKEITEDGAIITSVNGNGFEVTQEHPAQKSYNTMIKNYMSAMKQLNEMLPDPKTEDTEKAGETLRAFVAKGKK